MSLSARSVSPAGALPGCPGLPSPSQGHRQTPALILTLGSCSAPRLIRITREQSLCLRAQSSAAAQAREGRDGWRQDTGTLQHEEGRSIHPHDPPAPLLCWEGSREGADSFLPPQTLWEQLGRGMGMQELWRDNAHVCLGSYLIIRRRNQSRC